MDLPLGSREAVLDLRLSRGADTIHSDWIVLLSSWRPLESIPLRRLPSRYSRWCSVLIQLFPKVALSGQAPLEPIAEIGSRLIPGALVGLRADRVSETSEALMVMLLSWLIGVGSWSSGGRTKLLVVKTELK